jgi:hypothetical protein
MNQYAAGGVDTTKASSQEKSETGKKTEGGAQAAFSKEAPHSQAAREIPAREPEFSTSHHARKQYREMVASAIRDALGIKRDLGKYPLELELFLIIEKDGRLTLKRLVKDSGISPQNRAAVLDILGKLAPFPPFPQEMNSERELLDLKLQLN